VPDAYSLVATGRNTSSIWPEKLDQIHSESIVTKIINGIAEYSAEYRTVTTLIDKDPVDALMHDIEEGVRPELDWLDLMRETQIIVLPDMIVLNLDINNVNQALKDLYLTKPSTGVFGSTEQDSINSTALKGMVLICAHKVYASLM
jgi:hypothetical protein